MKKSLEDFREATDPILQMSFPGGPEEGVPTAWLDHLKAAPERLKGHLQEVASTSTI